MQIESLSWDEWCEEHIAGHGVRFEEVEEAVQDILYNRRSREYLLVIGRTSSGRYLTVVLDDEGDGFWYPVTARPTNRSERKLVRRKTRARRRK